MAQTKVKLISDGVIVQGNLHASHGITTAHIGEGSNLYYTDARVGSYLSSNGYATQSTIVAAITDSAPSTLDTLNELAAALGDDVNFSTTVTNSIALKAPIASPTFTGNVGIGTASPASKLDIGGMADPVLRIKSDAGGDPELRFDAAAANRSARIKFYDNGSAVGGFIDYLHNGNKMNFGAGSSSGVTMTVGDGVVGIGTDSPDFKFNVTKGYTSGFAKVAKFRSGNDATYVSFDTVQVVQTDVPCLAIIETPSGTQSDEQKLTFAVGDNKAIIGSTSTVTSGMSFYTNRAVTTTGFTAQGNLALHLANTGNVGIGTTAPNHLLHLKSTATGATGIIIENTNNAQVLDIDFWSNAGSAQGRIRYEEGPGAFGISPNVGSPNAMYINYSNNVGIGTTSPNEKLTVAGNVNIKGTGALLRWNSGDMQIRNAGSYAMAFDTYSGSALEERMRIDSSGNIGIGNTSPANKLRIDATAGQATTLSNSITNAAVYINSDTSNGSNNIRIGESGSGSYFLQASNSAGTTAYAINLNPFGGNIGIGTTSPNKALTVYGGNDNGIWIDSQGAQYTSLAFGHNGSEKANIAWDNTNGYTNITTYSNGHLALSTGGGIKAFLNTSGNFGIGTTSPGNKLHVVEGTNTWETAEFQSSSTTGCGITLVGANVSSLQWSMIANASNGGAGVNNLGFHLTGAGSSGGSTGYKMTIQASSGNVGIGTTSPSTKLDVVGEISSTDDINAGGKFVAANVGSDKKIAFRRTGANNFSIEHDTSALYFYNETTTELPIRFFNNGNVSMTAGNVGIGTTSPSEKLEVTGNFKLNGIVVQEGGANNSTYKHRTGNSSAHSGGNATVKFGRLYWTPAHWSGVAPVIKVTIYAKYYQGERREYIIKANYQNTNPVINELQPSSTQQKIGLSVGATTSAGYNYANQPVYYADLMWCQAPYMYGWCQVESQVPFLTSNPTSGWGGVVMDSSITQTNNAGSFTNYSSFFAGRILCTGLDGKTQVHPDVSYRTSDGELFYQTSSERYKTDIVNLESSLNKVNSLRPVRFTDVNTDEPGFGLIAEETNEIIPEVVFSKDDQIEGISYSNLTPFLIKAIQELKADNDSLKARIETLENN